MKCNPTDQFRLDLTEEQKRLCDWVAQQSRTGVRQIRYDEATAALDIHDEQLTRILRGMRERLDEIHAMVEAPIVNTRSPYFDVPTHARYIWDSYCRAEKEGALPSLVRNGAVGQPYLAGSQSVHVGFGGPVKSMAFSY